MKILYYSPKCNTNCTEEEFFEKMEYASSLGGDLIVFPENAPTPYDELLKGADVLNNEEYNYLLESLYGFCFEMGHGAVFSSTDDFGMHYSIFVNPFAEDGETFNKLYIKHCCEKGSVFELEDYDKCIREIFQPIIYRGTKLGLAMGEDIYLPKIFEKYRLNGVDTVVCPTGANLTEEYRLSCEDISAANNQILICAGYEGQAYSATPVGGIKNAQYAEYDICECTVTKSDMAKKCSILKNDLSGKYLPEKWIGKLN
jgi:predicted amidohydrolase